MKYLAVFLAVFLVGFLLGTLDVYIRGNDVRIKNAKRFEKVIHFRGDEIVIRLGENVQIVEAEQMP